MKRNITTKKFTIGKYLLRFYDSVGEAKANSMFSEYGGLKTEIPEILADKVAEYHPNILEYQENALAPLYKTYGKYRGGSECPIFAIGTRCNLKALTITKL